MKHRAERRQKYTDPDFRRDPKTDVYCAICQRDIRGPHRWGWFTHDTAYVVHPEDVARGLTKPSDLGWFRIGPECARRLGNEWTLADRPSDN